MCVMCARPQALRCCEASAPLPSRPWAPVTGVPVPIAPVQRAARRRGSPLHKRGTGTRRCARWQRPRGAAYQVVPSGMRKVGGSAELLAN